MGQVPAVQRGRSHHGTNAGLLESLLREGHVPIPSQWVDVDKNEFKKGRSDKSIGVVRKLRGCFRDELRCDAPTIDAETHCLIASYAASRKLKLRCGDISSAYFQSEPLERVIIMKQPRGGLPGVPPEAVLLCRLPVYGTMDAGRGFYARLCKVSCEEGLKVSKIAPGLYYVLGSDNLPAVLLGTHVDDLLWCATPEGEAIMERIMAKFDMGKVEDTDFRYCGRRLRQDEDFNVTIDTEDNTRPIRHIVIDPNRKSTEPATDRDITRLRSVVGSLAWVARYSRPDLCYRVNCLQRACARATVADLRDANRVVDLAKADAGISMFYPAGKFSWHDACVVSFSDASHAGEEGLRSQQGRFHYITSEKMVGSNEHVAHTIGYGSTTIRRVCRSTLQAETYAMQSAVESGDRLRAIRQFYASCEASCRSSRIGWKPRRR